MNDSPYRQDGKRLREPFRTCRGSVLEVDTSKQMVEPLVEAFLADPAVIDCSAHIVGEGLGNRGVIVHLTTAYASHGCNPQYPMAIFLRARMNVSTDRRGLVPWGVKIIDIGHRCNTPQLCTKDDGKPCIVCRAHLDTDAST
jgi:hypothetical protein